MKIKLNEIFTDPEFNCRGEIDPVSVGLLAKSIKAEGLITPILVMSFDEGGATWKCIAGHRRIAACKLLGLRKIEANTIDSMDDKTARKKNFQENQGRRDLTPTQEMRAIVAIYGDEPDRLLVASELGMSKKWVNDRLAIRKLEGRIQEQVDSGILGALDVSYILTSKPGERWDMARLLMENKEKGISAKTTAREVKLRSKSRGIREIRKGQELLEEFGSHPSWMDAMEWCAGKKDSVEFFGRPLDTLKKHGILE